MTESERRHQPELNRVQPVEVKVPVRNEFEIDPRESDDGDDAAANQRLNRLAQRVARQAALDPGDGIEL